MPVKRSKLIIQLIRIPTVGPVVRKCHDTLLRLKYQLYRDYLLNPRSRASFEKSGVALSNSQQQLVNELKTDGIATVDCEELFGNHDLWDEISEYATAFANCGQTNAEGPSDSDYDLVPTKANKFLRRHFTEDECISWTNPVLRVGVESKVLDVVNSYLGLWAKLKKVHLWHTTPSETERTRSGSENWHRDPEDEKMVTVFLYFTDVDTDSGPLQYIPNTRYEGKFHDLWPKFGGASATNVVTSDEISERITSNHIKTATCPRGTLLFCDTSGFHRGGFATKKQRLVAHWTYASPASLWPKRFSIAEDLGEFEVPDPSMFAVV